MAGAQTDVIVDVRDRVTISATNDGVLVWTEGAGNDATVNNSGQIDAGRFGINAVSGGLLSSGRGDVVVKNTSTGNIVSTDNGINAYIVPGGSTGNIVVTNDGSIRSTGGSGIMVKDPLVGVAPSAGNATISNTGAVLGNVHGVYVINAGDATVTNADYDNPNPLGLDRSGFISGTTATGVTLLAGGNATVNNSSALGIAGGTDGVSLVAIGNATVNNTNDASIIGLSGSGVSIIAGGSGSVTNEGGLIGGGKDGINALTMGDFTVTNQNTLTGNNVSQGRIYGAEDGIQFANVNILNNNGNGTTTISNEGSIIGVAGAGIKGFAVNDVIINNSVGGTISGGTDGINVLSLTKDVNIALGGSVTGGQNGILATSVLGNVVIGGDDGVYGSVDATSGTGILGVALGGGDVTIDAGAVNAGGANAFTIPGLGIGVGGGVVGIATGAGKVDVNLHGNVSVDSGLFGGAAIALGDGAATVKLDDGVNIDPPMIGMLAATVGGLATVDIGDGSFVDATLAGAVGLNFGAGGIDVRVGDVSKIGMNDVPQVGIFTLDTAGPASTKITLGTKSTVTGQTSGVVAIATEAEVVLTSNGSTIIGAGGSLSPVVAMMSGTSNVVNNLTGDLGGFHHRGTIESASGDLDDLAIFSAGGELSLTNQGDINGRIVALTTDGGSNVFANTMSASPLATTGGIWNTSGISAFVASGAGHNVVANGDQAEINVTGNALIGLVSEDGANTIDNQFGGVININPGATPGLSTIAAIALASETGDNEINNDGAMRVGGATAFGFASDSGSNTFDNHGTFLAEGVTTFGFATGTGTNWVHNANEMELTGITTFAFAGPAGNNTVDNDGLLRVNGLASFVGVDDFYNTDLITMQNGLVGHAPMVSPFYGAPVGDITYISGNFNASAGSKLAVDAILAGQYNSASDLLVVGGNATGKTAVYVNFDPTVNAEYNPVGTPVVGVVLGNAAPDAFYLANGPIDRGLFTYDLFLDSPGPSAPPGSNAFVLANYADSSAYALAEFAGLAQGVWNTTSDSWIDRAGDLRVSAQQGTGGDTTKKSGIWARMIGNGAERSTETTITPFQNQSVTLDTGYDQTLWGFQGGIDHEFEGTVADGVLIAGVLGGYVTSDVDFNNGDSVKLSGPQVGVYASWVKGGLYVDALIKGDFLKADYNVAGADDSTDSTTIGGRVETGYRFYTATGMFIEPNASLAYAHTKIDDITISGTPVNFDNGDGLEGKLGARFGGSSLKDGVKYDPYVSVGIAGQLLSNNSVFFDSGPGLVVEDDAPDVFGEVGAGINIFSTKSGWTGFAKADLRFGDDYVGGTGKIGARWAW
ncbi:autotransporter domain-containing protein [Kaistia granuli]|uniref:autotransporter domain-containing protein n=1 Tax=Kaistia granuli TaxID=363259 RepID=UPI0003757A09|nr:autotransporter domain-containing protein [Kaistia granuli]